MQSNKAILYFLEIENAKQQNKKVENTAPNTKALLSASIEIKTIILGNRNIFKFIGVRKLANSLNITKIKLIKKASKNYFLDAFKNIKLHY